MLKKSLGLVSGAALVMMLTYGCSSEENNPVAGGDSGTTPTGDSGPKKDTGTTPPVDGGDTACEPGDVSGFEPSWKTPAPFAQGACSNTQVDALMCQFDSSADQTACAALVKDKANEACQKCMFTPSSAAKLGPIVITGNLGSINIAGCIANAEGDTTDQGCGAKTQAADQCGDEACEANCPIDDSDDGESLAARNECTTAAATSVCQEFATGAQCADSLLEAGGAAEECNAGSDFLERATALAKLFCAGGTGDGGTDAPADAPADGG